MTGRRSSSGRTGTSRSAVETLVQPCETLRLPWSPTDHGAAWMYSPPLVMRCVQYTVSRYGSDGSVTTNSSDCCLSMTTMLPLDDGVFGLAEADRDRLDDLAVLLHRHLVGLVVGGHDDLVADGDVGRDVLGAPALASCRPPVASRTVSLVPACQYSFGRKCTSPPLNQFQVPTCGRRAGDHQPLLDGGAQVRRDAGAEPDDDRHAHAVDLVVRQGRRHVDRLAGLRHGGEGDLLAAAVAAEVTVAVYCVPYLSCVAGIQVVPSARRPPLTAAPDASVSVTGAFVPGAAAGRVRWRWKRWSRRRPAR